MSKGDEGRFKRQLLVLPLGQKSFCLSHLVHWRFMSPCLFQLSTHWCLEQVPKKLCYVTCAPRHQYIFSCFQEWQDRRGWGNVFPSLALSCYYTNLTITNPGTEIPEMRFKNGGEARWKGLVLCQPAVLLNWSPSSWTEDDSASAYSHGHLSDPNSSLCIEWQFWDGPEHPQLTLILAIIQIETSSSTVSQRVRFKVESKNLVLFNLNHLLLWQLTEVYQILSFPTYHYNKSVK